MLRRTICTSSWLQWLLVSRNHRRLCTVRLRETRETREALVGVCRFGRLSSLRFARAPLRRTLQTLGEMQTLGKRSLWFTLFEWLQPEASRTLELLLVQTVQRCLWSNAVGFATWSVFWRPFEVRSSPDPVSGSRCRIPSHTQDLGAEFLDQSSGESFSGVFLESLLESFRGRIPGDPRDLQLRLSLKFFNLQGENQAEKRLWNCSKW